MTRYYQLLFKNDVINYCSIVGRADTVMTHKDVVKFKWANEPENRKDFYYEIVEIKDISDYKLLPSYNKALYLAHLKQKRD